MAETYSVDAPAVALTAGTAKTVVAFGPGSATARIVDLTVSCDAVATGLLKMELIRWTTNGTATSYTPAKVNGEAQNRSAISSGYINYTVEPTSPTVVKTWELVLPTSPFELLGPLGREILYVVTSGYAGLRFTSTTVSPNVYANLQFEE
jgi:hypothetical protein